MLKTTMILTMIVDETKTINLANYEKVVYNNRELLSNWAYAKQDALEKNTRAANIAESEYFDKLKVKFTTICFTICFRSKHNKGRS